MGALVEYKRVIKKEKCRDLLKSATTKIKKLKSVIEIVEEKELSEKEKALILKIPPIYFKVLSKMIKNHSDILIKM